MNLNIKYTNCPICKRFFGIEIIDKEDKSLAMLDVHWSNCEARNCVRHTEEKIGKNEGEYTFLPHLKKYALTVIKIEKKKGNKLEIRF